MIRVIVFIVSIGIILFPTVVLGKEQEDERMNYYKRFENVVVPWYYLAAVDQYERNIQAVRIDIPKKEGVIAIQMSEEFWVGAMNPNPEDTSPLSIQYYEGHGVDGNGDGVASKEDVADVLYTMATYLSSFGAGEENFKQALWEYYKSESIINQIVTIAKLFEHYGRIDLEERSFPVPIRGFEYSYKNTWGASRGWGGRRIHEGTDIFAGYGTPVRSVSYGVIEVMGWNNYGGWRVGIRDNLNTYHYYAHLAYFNKKLKVGDIVEPGTVIGAVGSSGYGKEGTSGKFPPHLHYGMYKFNGRVEWAFNPYPYLVLWEKSAKNE